MARGLGHGYPRTPKPRHPGPGLHLVSPVYHDRLEVPLRQGTSGGIPSGLGAVYDEWSRPSLACHAAGGTVPQLYLRFGECGRESRSGAESFSLSGLDICAHSSTTRRTLTTESLRLPTAGRQSPSFHPGTGVMCPACSAPSGSEVSSRPRTSTGAGPESTWSLPPSMMCWWMRTTAGWLTGGFGPSEKESGGIWWRGSADLTFLLCFPRWKQRAATGFRSSGLSATTAGPTTSTFLRPALWIGSRGTAVQWRGSLPTTATGFISTHPSTKSPSWPGLLERKHISIPIGRTPAGLSRTS